MFPTSLSAEAVPWSKLWETRIHLCRESDAVNTARRHQVLRQTYAQSRTLLSGLHPGRTSETEYDFTEESPFQEQQDIKVDKYFTMVYFGPFRDENKIDPDSREQLGANHVISKTGGEGFTDEQIKELTKANGKDKDGIPF